MQIAIPPSRQYNNNNNTNNTTGLVYKNTTHSLPNAARKPPPTSSLISAHILCFISPAMSSYSIFIPLLFIWHPYFLHTTYLPNTCCVANPSIHSSQAHSAPRPKTLLSHHHHPSTCVTPFLGFYARYGMCQVIYP